MHPNNRIWSLSSGLHIIITLPVLVLNISSVLYLSNVLYLSIKLHDNYCRRQQTYMYQIANIYLNICNKSVFKNWAVWVDEISHENWLHNEFSVILINIICSHQQSANLILGPGVAQFLFFIHSSVIAELATALLSGTEWIFSYWTTFICEHLGSTPPFVARSSVILLSSEDTLCRWVLHSVSRTLTSEAVKIWFIVSCGRRSVHCQTEFGLNKEDGFICPRGKETRCITVRYFGYFVSEATNMGICLKNCLYSTEKLKAENLTQLLS